MTAAHDFSAVMEGSDLTAVRGVAVLLCLMAAGFGLYALPTAAHLI